MPPLRTFGQLLGNADSLAHALFFVIASSFFGRADCPTLGAIDARWYGRGAGVRGAGGGRNVAAYFLLSPLPQGAAQLRLQEVAPRALAFPCPRTISAARMPQEGTFPASACSATRRLRCSLSQVSSSPGHRPAGARRGARPPRFPTRPPQAGTSRSTHPKHQHEGWTRRRMGPMKLGRVKPGGCLSEGWRPSPPRTKGRPSSPPMVGKATDEVQADQPTRGESSWRSSSRERLGSGRRGTPPAPCDELEASPGEVGDERRAAA